MIFMPTGFRLIGAYLGSAYRIPDTLRGRAHFFPGGHLENQRLSTDSLGSTTLTLTNVVPGSRYRIEVSSTGALAEPAANAEGTAGASTVNITLNYYAAGNTNNTLRIKVRKGSAAQKYQPFETAAVLTSGGASAYVAQVPDNIA